MRVSGLQRLRQERGAVAAIVALSMVVLLGAVALSVDFGLMFAKRRGMVNASDSGALAAAVSYARQEATCGSDDGPAQTQADSLATSNVAGAARDSYVTDCANSKVTVTYSVSQDLLFAPILGIGSQVVRATATAYWGPAGASTQVAPMMLSEGRLSNCDIPDNVEVGDSCYFWWDNAGTDADLTNAEWGIMDLDNWDVAPTASCPGSASQSDVSAWITNGYPGTLALRNPPPTYVCRSGGDQGNALNNEINAKHGDLLPFPVNDPQQQVQSGGTLCRPDGVDGNCSVYMYAIVGFAKLEVDQVYSGHDAVDHCPGHTATHGFGSLRCLVATWQGFQSDGEIGGGGGGDFGYGAVGLSG